MEALNESLDTSLMVNEKDCHRLSLKLIKLSFGSITDTKVSKIELRFFTEQVLAKTCTGRKFNEESFERGYKSLDPEEKGYVEFERIRDLVENHFSSIGLHK